MTTKQVFVEQVIVKVMTLALIGLSMYAAVNVVQIILPNDHIGKVFSLLGIFMPILTVLSLGITINASKAKEIYLFLLWLTAFLFCISVEWMIHYQFALHNIETKELTRIENSPEYLAKQNKLLQIDAQVEATKQYASVDMNALKAQITANQTLIAQLKDKKCPDTKCLEEKRETARQAAVESDLLQGKVNGATDYQNALKAKTAALESLPTPSATPANVNKASVDVIAIGWATLIVIVFLMCAIFSAVASDLAVLAGFADEQKRARLRKEKPVQNDEQPIEQPKELSFFEHAKEISGEYLTRKQAKEIHYETQLTKPLTFLLGSHAVDLEQAPHIVVAGASNQGKSSTIRGVLNQIISKNSPDDVQIVGVDLKRVELGVLKGLPHLIKPIATDKNQALKLIEWVREEMEMRYELLEDKGVEKIQRLKGEKIPYLILIVDEGAELAEIMETITDLARKGRAAGIHIIFATQYPTKQLLGNQFMEQMQTRICHFLKTPEASRAVLGIMPNNLNAYNIQNAGEAIIVDHKQSILMQIDYVSMDTLKETVSTAISKYSKQPISPKEPSPKKTTLQATYNFNTTSTAVAYNLQPKEAAITAHASDFGGNVVQFPPRVQPTTHATFQNYTMGSLALKNDENQQLDNATLAQPDKVANQAVQPDKTQQNQQGCNATTDATAKVANVQLATFKMQPPLATSEVRKLVDWALNELDEPKSDQAIADFIFRSTGRKLNKGSVYKYRLELQSTKEQKK
jgi:hypothetical protein